MAEELVAKILLWFEPFTKWVDHTFTIPHSIKKVNGDHYYKYRDKINTGVVLLTNTDGVGSNLLNPSEINHAAIYFGKGLKTSIELLIFELTERDSSIEKINRLKKVITDYEVDDEICYVIEAVGAGVKPTNLVRFMTTKDKFQAYEPLFCDKNSMRQAALNSIHDLGLPYDFAFSDRENAKYCFEVAADAYENLSNDIKLKKEVITIFGIDLYKVFLSDTFSGDRLRWKCTINL